MVSFTRLIACNVLLLSAPALYAQMVPPQPGKILVAIPPDLAAAGIEISTSLTDPEFQSRTAAYLPSDTRVAIEPLTAYGVFVKNRTGAGISRIHVRYVSRRANGALSIGENTTQFPAGKLKTGTELLVLPVAIFTMKFAPGSPDGAAMPLNVSQEVRAFEGTARLWRERGVSIHVDSVVLEDGRLFGPDLYGFRYVNAAQAAAASLIKEKLSLSDAEFEEYAFRLIKIPQPDLYREDGSLDQARKQQQTIANIALVRIQGKVPRETIVKFLDGLIARPSPTLIRTTP